LNQTANRKQHIRDKAKKDRDSLAVEKRRKFDLAIGNRLFDLASYKEADKVLFYASFKTEVNTELMIVEALDSGKTVLLPKVNSEENRLTKHIIKDLKEISPGYMGIPEPVTDSQMKVEDIHMLVIPGVAFDLKGNRTGYGGGFYDRLLPRVKGDRTIVALAYEVQVFDSLPCEPHDIPVDFIITEERIIACNG
jgi:5-formyltetrahydrofolate cyclo-ligase